MADPPLDDVERAGGGAFIVGGRSRAAPLFFFNDTATTEIYTLSLHDALPISGCVGVEDQLVVALGADALDHAGDADRKSTRLNSSHGYISYAVFCLKKKKSAGARAGRDSAGRTAAAPSCSSSDTCRPRCGSHT